MFSIAFSFLLFLFPLKKEILTVILQQPDIFVKWCKIHKSCTSYVLALRIPCKHKDNLSAKAYQAGFRF